MRGVARGLSGMSVRVGLSGGRAAAAVAAAGCALELSLLGGEHKLPLGQRVT